MSDNGALLERISKPMSEKESQTLQFLREGSEWLSKSRRIALGVLYYLDEKGMTKKELADRMGVTPTYVGKLLKGKENLSLETISKIEDALGVELLDVKRPYANKDNSFLSFEGIHSYA